MIRVRSIEGGRVDHRQYEIEVALRLSMINSDAYSALADLRQRIGTIRSDGLFDDMRHPGITGDKPSSVWPYDEIRALMSYFRIRVAGVRPGWVHRLLLVRDNPLAIKTLDPSSVIEILSNVGHEKALAPHEWLSTRGLTMTEYVISRLMELSVPPKLASDSSSDDHHIWRWPDPDDLWTGGIGESGYPISSVFRALTCDSTDWSPPMYAAMSKSKAVKRGYWFSLAVTAVGYFGWPKPHLALLRWLGGGMKNDKAGLDVAARLWGRDATALALWPGLAGAGRRIHNALSAQKLKEPEEMPSLGKVTSGQPKLEELLTVNPHWSAQLSGGSDPLHLEPHLSSLLLQSSNPFRSELIAQQAVVNQPSAEVHLIVPAGLGWCAAIHRLGDSLSYRSDGKAWTIHVTSKPFGYMGAYRRSTETDRWFAGRHSTHLLGWSS